jgi:hypothetical protein
LPDVSCRRLDRLPHHAAQKVCSTWRSSFLVENITATEIVHVLLKEKMERRRFLKSPENVLIIVDLDELRRGGRLFKSFGAGGFSRGIFLYDRGSVSRFHSDGGGEFVAAASCWPLDAA